MFGERYVHCGGGLEQERAMTTCMHRIRHGALLLRPSQMFSRRFKAICEQALPYVNGCPSSLLQVRKVGRWLEENLISFYFFIFFSAEKGRRKGCP